MDISVEHLKIIAAFGAGGLCALTLEWLWHVWLDVRSHRDHNDRINGRQA